MALLFLFRVSRLVGGVWLLWGILTVVTGFGALILVNPAFNCGPKFESVNFTVLWEKLSLGLWQARPL